MEFFFISLDMQYLILILKINHNKNQFEEINI